MGHEGFQFIDDFKRLPKQQQRILALELVQRQLLLLDEPNILGEGVDQIINVALEPENTQQCDHQYPDKMSRYCGAYICYECGNHKGLERCFCGWSRSGGDGRKELIEMGEQIDEDV